MDVKTPNFVDIFEDEYHLEKPAVDESTEMMRQQTNRRIWEINRQQIEKDKKEFYDIFCKWYEKYYLSSNPCIKFKDPAYEKLKKMGRRALPALYELAVNHDMYLVELLENIYECKTPEVEMHSFEDLENDYDRVHRFWLEKMKSDKTLWIS